MMLLLLLLFLLRLLSLCLLRLLLLSHKIIKEQSGSIESGTDWIRAPPKVPKHLDDTDNVMKHLAAKKIRVFAGIGHGYYFWNFRCVHIYYLLNRNRNKKKKVRTHFRLSLSLSSVSLAGKFKALIYTVPNGHIYRQSNVDGYPTQMMVV